jgi:hypothetical protein
MSKRLWGDRDHRDVAVGLGNLGGLLQDMGRLDEALPVLQASVEMRKRVWGDRDHRDVAVGLQPGWSAPGDGSTGGRAATAAGECGHGQASAEVG